MRIIFCGSHLKKTGFHSWLLTGFCNILFVPKNRAPETGRFCSSYPAILFELWDKYQPETQIVIAGNGPAVTIRGETSPRCAVPTATTIHTVCTR